MLLVRLYYDLKFMFFTLIRPLFVNHVDPNEDFLCCWCGKPVLIRELYCSEKCSKYAEENYE